MSIPETWQRIEAWLAVHAPPVRKSLREPATRDEIAELETTFGLKLPEDFKASLSRHNGQAGENISGLFPYRDVLGPGPAWELISTAAAVAEWKMLGKLLDGGDFKGNEAKPDRGVQNAWWDKKWIPIAGNGGGDNVCLDMNPTADGAKGQVVLFTHDIEKRPVLASSFEAWLTDLANGLEAGRYIYDEKKRNMVKA